MPDRRTIIIGSVIFGVLTIAGLAIPGKNGGSILILLAFLLVGITTATAQSDEVDFKVRDWAVRVLLIMALAAVGIVKLFRH